MSVQLIKMVLVGLDDLTCHEKLIPDVSIKTEYSCGSILCLLLGLYVNANKHQGAV